MEGTHDTYRKERKMERAKNSVKPQIGVFICQEDLAGLEVYSMRHKVSRSGAVASIISRFFDDNPGYRVKD